MTDYHESWDALPEAVRDMHRALISLREEIEAIDWYGQRIALCTDESLASVLAHNRDEEIEHAVLVLEWVRRKDPTWDAQLRQYLFTTRELGHADHEQPARPSGTDLGLTRAPKTAEGGR
jgi:hypothetical protein